MSLYLFGNLGREYTQCINDYTSTKFKSFVAKSNANSQMIIHRDGVLMYYTYIRRLHNEESSNMMRYIGISFVLNDALVKNIDILFAIFEGAITTIASRGTILKYIPSGQIVANVEKIHQAQSEFAHIQSYLTNELSTFMLDNSCELPPLDYSINSTEYKTYKFDDSREEILESLRVYPTVYIYKDENYENEESQSFSNTLSRLNKEKFNALDTVDRQKEEIAELKKIQKNYKLVIWLIVIICLGSLIGFGTITNRNVIIKRLRETVSNQEAQIQNQSHEITTLKGDVNSKESTINSLQTDNRKLQSQKDSVSRINKRLGNDLEVVKSDKRELEQSLSTKERSLVKANNTIKSLKDDKKKLAEANSKLKNRKLEPEKYEVYSRTGNKAWCYYKKGNSYYKTNGYYSDYSIVYVYYKNSEYALTQAGYVRLVDIRKK